MRGYFDVRTKQDFASVRALLAGGLSIRGPCDVFGNADDFVGVVSQLRGLVKAVGAHKVFDGAIDSICLIFDMAAFSSIFPG